MKKIFFITMTTVLATTALFLTSCNKDEVRQDNQKPVVNLIEPEDGDLIKIGNAHGMHFEMKVEDNEMLASYKLEIHNNFDHHTHKGVLKHGETETQPFFFNRTYSLEGKKNATIHHHDVVIPSDATPGDYHLVIYVADKAGNETMVARNIVLSLDAPDHDHDHDHGHDHE